MVSEGAGEGRFRLGARRREEAGAPGRDGAGPDPAGRLGLRVQQLQPPPGRAEIADAPVRLDEVARPPQDPRLVHAAARHRVGNRFEVFDRGLRPRASELEEAERGARPRDHRVRTRRGGRGPGAETVRTRVVDEAEPGLDARLHRVEPGTDARQPERVLPHLGRRGRVGLGPVAAPPRELGTDRERDCEEEQTAGVARAPHHHVEQELGAVPVLEDEVGEHDEAEDVFGVGEVALDQPFCELRERRERHRHGRIAGKQPGFDARHRARNDVEAAGALAARNGALREGDRAVDVEREHRDVHRIRQESSRALGIRALDVVGRLDEDLRALLRSGAVALELSGRGRDVGAQARIDGERRGLIELGEGRFPLAGGEPGVRAREQATRSVVVLHAQARGARVAVRSRGERTPSLSGARDFVERARNFLVEAERGRGAMPGAPLVLARPRERVGERGVHRALLGRTERVVRDRPEQRVTQRDAVARDRHEARMLRGAQRVERQAERAERDEEFAEPGDAVGRDHADGATRRVRQRGRAGHGTPR